MTCKLYAPDINLIADLIAALNKVEMKHPGSDLYIDRIPLVLSTSPIEPSELAGYVVSEAEGAWAYREAAKEERELFASWSEATVPTQSEPDWRNLDPARKTEIIEAMGFSRANAPHDNDCPVLIDRGYNCNCVSPPSWYTAPQDVLKHWGQSWDERLKKAREQKGEDDD